jgi:hypothetical protein
MKSIDYEESFYDWALHNAQLLRQGRLSEIDVEHIAEELESMGKSHRQEIVSRLKILLGHLLKWEYQFKSITERWPWEGGSWRGTTREQRMRINDLIKDNPSLKPYLPEAIILAYPEAIELASEDTGFLPATFSQDCPYTLDQVLNRQFFPQCRD